MHLSLKITSGMHAYSICGIWHIKDIRVDTMSIKRFASNLLSSKTLPLTEVQEAAELYTPRSRYTLDPAVAALNLGSSPDTFRAIQEALMLQRRRENQPVDVGAFELDLLLNKVGLSTNLANVRRRPQISMPLADDAFYKRQVKAAPTGGPATDWEFVRLSNTPMMDWDVPDPYHQNPVATTIQNLGDVEQLTRDYVRNHPESQLRIYQTPGGYRAWEMSEMMNPLQFGPRFEELNVDPFYAKIAQQVPASRFEGGIPTFASRISHKPGRTDWVAQPIMELSGSHSLPSKRSAQLVKTLHDDPIRNMYLGPRGVSPDAIALLKQQMPSVSTVLQRELTKRFGL